MAQGMDFCDLVTALRPYFHPKDRDISLLVGREIYVPDPDDPGDPDKPPTIPPIPVTCGVVPVGGIIGWSGALVDIPTCWQLCDGTNGTPESRNVFIMGAGDTYNPGDTGGSATKDISHTHADTFSVDNDTHNHNDTFTIDNDAHTHDVTGTSGSESSHKHWTLDAGIHNHDDGAYNAAAPIGVTGHSVAYDSDVALVSEASFEAHVHDITGTSGASVAHNHGLTGVGQSHSHGDGSYAAASDTHNHGISGGVSNDTHNHVLSGSIDTGGSAALNVINPYIAWGWIQRMN